MRYSAGARPPFQGQAAAFLIPRRARLLSHDQAAFTLLELLIVMAIIGILCSIVYPSYAAHVLRARRLEGKLALVELMAQQEAIYSRANRYLLLSADTAVDANPALAGLLGAGGFKWWSGASAAASAYQLHTQSCAGVDLARCVEAVATPGTERVDSKFRDADCGALTLLSTGEWRAASGKPGCWQ